MRRILAFGLATVLAAACGQPSPAAPSSPPTAPGPSPVPGAAPKAVLSIGVGGEIPALGITNHELLFDASQSTGDGLTYLVDFGDGASSTEPRALHASRGAALGLTARLTVTDRFGRTDSTSQRYFLGNVDNSGCCATRWHYAFPEVGDVRPTQSLTLLQQGATLSGRYRGRDQVQRTITGTLTGDRSMTLRTTDGAIELTGGLAWRQGPTEYMSPYVVVLRLTIKGGELDGQTFDFRWVDPF